MFCTFPLCPRLSQSVITRASSARRVGRRISSKQIATVSLQAHVTAKSRTNFGIFRANTTRFQRMSSSSQKIDPDSKFLKLARLCNNAFYKGVHLDHPDYAPFVCEGTQIGVVKSDFRQELMQNHADVFQACDFGGRSDCVTLNPELDDYGKRSRAIDSCLRRMREDRKDILALSGWREECYEIRDAFNREPLFRMERAATCLFGLIQCGADINGYVKHEDGKLSLWMQRRSKTKQTWPGKMDNFVGGGLCVGLTPSEAAVKEALEEANVEEELARKMTPAGTVTLFYESERGLHPNVEFIFDLELPEEFRPGNNDGEVEGFELVPQDQLLELVASPEMKTTSCPITLDFLVRRGIINSDNENDLPGLVENLHLPLHRIYKLHRGER